MRSALLLVALPAAGAVSVVSDPAGQALYVTPVTHLQKEYAHSLDVKAKISDAGLGWLMHANEGDCTECNRTVQPEPQPSDAAIISCYGTSSGGNSRHHSCRDHGEALHNNPAIPRVYDGSLGVKEEISATGLGSLQQHVYNALVHIDSDERKKQSRFEEGLPLIGSFAEQTGLLHVGAWRVHKHFDLEAGEVLLTSIHAPDSCGKGAELHVKVVQEAELPDAIPLTLLFHAGRWAPAQYLALTDPAPEGFVKTMRERAAWVHPRVQDPKTQAAMQKLGGELEHHGLAKWIGLTIRSSDVITLDEAGMTEFTDVAQRTQVFVSSSLVDDEMGEPIKTHIFFEYTRTDQPGPSQLQPSDSCIYGCLEWEDSHEYHHDSY